MHGKHNEYLLTIAKKNAMEVCYMSKFLLKKDFYML